ncbi:MULTISPECIES: trans-sulfuration enzyme family protein [unclassified Brevibacterium]|uniref:trans-sulfuration enzyme family protein n=1 Tax=unclassified Brevibacterium TaxID=2614124 RepID=UPI00109261F0|nr:PLP-dependent transferase [Brevibacterium sp. S22]TGD31323.1 PLP-dependent transferase [Brevibacterium sp. S22]
MNSQHPETRMVHGGMDGLTEAGVHVPAIDLSTTNPVNDIRTGGDSYESLASGQPLGNGDSAVYQRLWQPGVSRFETALADLEIAEEAVAFATGMAALTAALLAAVDAGTPHIVAVRPLYGGSDHLLESGLLGTTVTWAAEDEVGDAIQSDTGLVIIETPANPSLDLVDISAVVAAAGNVPVLVDNTFCTPVLQRPIAHGAALVLHSATKYLGGHGDAMGGIIATNSQWAARLRRVRAITGALLHPMGAYLLHRGLRTLSVRMRAAQDTAAELARRLRPRPEIAKLHYPGLPDGDPRGLIGRQMDGGGAMIAIELAGGFSAAGTFVEHCSLIVHAVSLGGVDTLIQHPASLTHRPVAATAKPGDSLVRISVGLEHVDDLAQDLFAALDAISAAA